MPRLVSTELVIKQALLDVSHQLELIDSGVVLRPARHKIGYFGDVVEANLLGLGMEKLNLTQQKHTFTKKCTTKQTHKKLTPGLVASYNIRPGNIDSGFGAS